VEELRALKFYTVESVANAADAQLQRIGMVAGMSPYAFRDAAVRFLALVEGRLGRRPRWKNRAKSLEEEQNKKLMDSEKAMASTARADGGPQDAIVATEATKGKPGPKKARRCETTKTSTPARSKCPRPHSSLSSRPWGSWGSRRHQLSSPARTRSGKDISWRY
jgi:hypothetical protein